MADISDKQVVTDQNDQNGQTIQPGTVITPGEVPATPVSVPPTSAQPVAVPVEPSPVAKPQPTQVAESEQATEAAEPSSESDDDSSGITWTASEFVAHDKSAGWYLSLAIVAAAVALLVYVLTRDYISAGVVIFAAVLFGVYGSHKPRQLEYRLSQKGIDIDKKHYSFSDFKTFSVIPEGAFSSIVLMPLKRFAPPLSIYFAPEDEQRIIDLLTSILPFEERRRDAIDSLMHRIRF